MIMDHLEYCIMKYGTPSYLFDIDKMKETVGKFRKALGQPFRGLAGNTEVGHSRQLQVF